MIKSWNLCNFKSVYEKTDLEFAPLTIFAGANSSGKTTFIQSLLLTAQTLQNPVVTRPIVLNGHILKLGAFDDIVSNGHESENITIGFTLNPVKTGEESFGTHYLYRSQDWKEATINCEFSFSSAGAETEKELVKLQPLLEECRIKARFESTIESNEKIEDELHFRRSTNSILHRLQQNNLPNSLENRPEHIRSLRYEVVKPQESPSIARYYNRPTGKTIGINLRHFLPGEFAISYNKYEYQLFMLTDTLTSEGEIYPYFADFNVNEDEINSNSILKRFLLNEIKNIISHQENLMLRQKNSAFDGLSKLESNLTLRSLNSFLFSIPINLRKCINSHFIEKKDELKALFMQKLKPKYDMTYTPIAGVTEMATNYIQHFFSTRVKYLGPLRDEPKSVYPLSGTTDTKDIGIIGEHTAAVLDIHRNTLVRYIPSNQISSNILQTTPVVATLSDAVQDWLSYMGVASNFITSDKGKLGHEMRVSTGTANSLHDLTHVGVGVSQVLPILVLALLAEPGSTLIFEQPELHLHPRVQTRLADFFVSIISLKKQCLVESHSEYLINRLRFWSASTEGDDFCKSVIMYFVEKELDYSIYETVYMNKYGYIERWPRGFFDEAEENSKKILEAAREKHRREGLR
ncbi:AAA family ATPase [Anaerospora hongkongensis]|uniref:AAA family ATPase n=1 Tax=Anaerospora hongkongensis TaxID=244830 RepID=UPI002898BEFF|nr:DUF3696 domain-containing protein [Anaerospora hongkongensis]